MKLENRLNSCLIDRVLRCSRTSPSGDHSFDEIPAKVHPSSVDERMNSERQEAQKHADLWRHFGHSIQNSRTEIGQDWRDLVGGTANNEHGDDDAGGFDGGQLISLVDLGQSVIRVDEQSGTPSDNDDYSPITENEDQQWDTNRTLSETRCMSNCNLWRSPTVDNPELKIHVEAMIRQVIQLR